LLAIACRRGDIKGSDVGAIRIEANYSLIDVARTVADRFETAAAMPDSRNPRLQIHRAHGPAQPPPRPVPPPRAERPSRARVSAEPTVKPDRPSRARVGEPPPPVSAGAKPPRVSRVNPDVPRGGKWTGPVLRRRK
jgi:ATP-dependent RNA helicase DeaD